MALILLGLWRVALPLASVTLASTVAVAMATAPHEPVVDRAVAEALSPELARGVHHHVKDPIAADGYMLHFAVDSVFGPFEVTGYGALRKLVRELHAIAALRAITASEAWGRQVVDSATSSLQFAGKLITRPADTLTGLPRGLYKGAENLATAVSTGTDPTGDGKAQVLLLQADKKRAYAAALGVDPYTSNRALQKELNSVAWAAAVGSWTVTAATMPIGGTAGTVLTATSIGDAITDYLKVEGPSDLRRRNETRLLDLGLAADLVRRYLDHPTFSPRHETILVESLGRIGRVPGLAVFLEAALAADDEVDANLFVSMAQIMRGYHETVSPLVGVGRVAGLVVAQARSGTALIAFPLDYGAWTERADRLSDELKATYAAPGFNGAFDLWVVGAVSPMAREQLARKGITVTEWINRRVEIID